MSVQSRLLLLTILLGLAVSGSYAQENLPDETPQFPEPAASDRIVEGRPRLYTLKRVVHPLNWLEGALRPTFRASQRRMIQQLLGSREGKLKFGIGGAGSGSGFGPVVTFFDDDAFGRPITLEVPLLYTYRQYETYMLNAGVPLPSRFGVRGLTLDLGTAYRSRSRDDFYGIGNDSPEGDEWQFRTITRQVVAGFTLKANDEWTAGLHGAYRNTGVTKPSSGRSVQERFDAASAPGLSGATLASAAFVLARDTQARQDYTFKGGFDELLISFNDSVKGDEFRYWRYRLSSEHFFWLTSDGRKLIAARGFMEWNRGSLPFFDMPVLGNSETLRGFENFRFRDKTALAMTLEYRYRIWRAMDFGLFVDQGQVAPSIDDLALQRFHTGYGVRLFVWAKPDIPISIEYGRSSEGGRLYVDFNTRF